MHAELSKAFWSYTNALISNDIDTVIALFWDSEHTLRFGSNESLYGIDAIVEFRNTQRGQKLDIDITRLVITSFGENFGTANCEMLFPDKNTTGRMSHTWVRMEEGWRIVAAQVSVDSAE